MHLQTGGTRELLSTRGANQKSHQPGAEFNLAEPGATQRRVRLVHRDVAVHAAMHATSTEGVAVHRGRGLGPTIFRVVVGDMW